MAHILHDFDNYNGIFGFFSCRDNQPALAPNRHPDSATVNRLVASGITSHFGATVTTVAAPGAGSYPGA